MNVRHFVLTPQGGIHEFTAEQAALIAAGSDLMPEFADSRVRYLQVSVDDESGTELKIQTAAASIQFDHAGKMTQATPPSPEEQVSRFEHDAVVQWAIKNIPSVAPVFH
ncbi:MAG: hypothetical protein ACT4PZ_24570 [Panacagrimonas sp.]